MQAPIARPRNTYQLLNEVKKVIREEPLRLSMGQVLIFGIDITGRGYQLPDCGTVGCVGGWSWALTRTTKTVEACITKGQIGTLEDVATILYGATDAYRVAYPDTFLGKEEYDADLHKLFYTFPKEYQGTPEYAEVVCSAIDAFQEKWKQRLKATKVRVHA